VVVVIGALIWRERHRGTAHSRNYVQPGASHDAESQRGKGGFMEGC
jgi:hypothetical protein